MTSAENAPEVSAPAEARWFQRVLPVTGMSAALVLVATLLVPDFREQVALSATHRPQEYVELYFARTAAGTQVVCTSGERGVRVRFAVTSHLRGRERLPYTVAVRHPARNAAGDRTTGAVTVEAGRTVEVTRTLQRPAGRGYEVAVRLPTVHGNLRAHCPRPS